MSKKFKKNWPGLSPIANLDYFICLDTPSQRIIDHLIDFWKIFFGDQKMENLPQISPISDLYYFFLPKYTSTVHYWSLNWFFKNLCSERKIENIDSAYHQSPNSVFFWPKYTFPVHYSSFGWFLKDLFGNQKIENLPQISPVNDHKFFILNTFQAYFPNWNKADSKMFRFTKARSLSDPPY